MYVASSSGSLPMSFTLLPSDGNWCFVVRPRILDRDKEGTLFKSSFLELSGLEILYFTFSIVPVSPEVYALEIGKKRQDVR